MNNNNRLFLDLHVIQNLPPSNINRDDTGSPKTCMYGGVTRARVSSQSWKKAIRDYFIKNGNLENIGIRSLNVVEYVAEKIIKMKPDINKDDAMKLADKAFTNAGIKTKDYKVSALFFISDKQAENLAKAAIENIYDKNTLKKILNDDTAIDIALFGRMLADDPSLNEDASSQVAHSISTHGAQTEFDFFTAVDDFKAEANAGAGMLGTVEFNSSTLYRYANIALHDFLSKIKDKKSAIDAVKLFVKAFSNSLPTGKVNTFANQTLPQLLLVTLRDDRPVNLVSAFEQPIKSDDGYEEKSIKALFKEYKKVLKFVNKPLATFYIMANDIQTEDIGEEKPDLQDMLSSLEDGLNTYLPEIRSDEI